MPTTLAFQRLGQEYCHEFEAILNYSMRLYFKAIPQAPKERDEQNRNESYGICEAQQMRAFAAQDW